jgi:tRNA1Val (adenine37-N6)-methyltransferase
MFSFKEFTISQQQTAMKVCTDSCLFGALVDIEKNVEKIIDIGTGTGLLALMLAQKSNSIKVIGLEIEPLAAEEAEWNVKNSPFSNQIEIINESLQKYQEHCKTTFDLILCNPPFYEKHLLSPVQNKNIAHHSVTLTLEEICIATKKLLNENGSFWILLPPQAMHKFNEIALQFGFSAQKMIDIRHNPQNKIIRSVGQFCKKKVLMQKNEEISIYETDSRTYSQRFISLLGNYYTIF